MTIEMMLAGLSTFAVHATVLLGLAWAVDRGFLRRYPAWRELLWRVALFGALLTAGAQAASNAPLPLRFAWPSMSPVNVPALGTDDGVDVIGHASRSMPKEVANGRVAAKPADADVSRVGAASQNGLFVTASPGPSWPALLLAGWLAGTLLSLARVAAAWLRLRRTLAGAEPLRKIAIDTDVAALAIAANIAPPRLAVLDDLASPIAVLGGRVVLPRWAVEMLDREQLRAMLAHETAHLARRDPSWKLAAAVCCALLWFLPLATLARRRLDETAELACDAWAARHLGDGRSLAECLAECAEHRLGGFESALVPGMAQRESSLLQRIDQLIGGSPMETTLSRARAAAAVTFTLAVASFLLPGFGTAIAHSTPPDPPPPPSLPGSPPRPPSPPTPPKESRESHVHISSDIDLGRGKREYTSIRVGDSDRMLSVKIKGTVVFNDRDDGIASLSDGGSASFAETKQGVERRVDYAMRDGKLEQRYFVGDREQPLDDAGRSWIATLLPNIIRDTAIGAEARVKRIHAAGGAAAVFDEIARIQSDYARRIYLEQLFALGKLAPAEVTRALQAIDKLDSDYERRNALAALATIAPFDEAQQKLVLGQVDKIDSDYERAEMLIGVLPKLAPTPELRKAWLAAAEKIGSDYERRRVLSALLDGRQVDEATLQEVLRASNAIGSDYERRELLVSTIRRADDSERLAAAYATVVDGIGSDYERREATMALLRAPKFGKLGARSVLDVADRIGSDHECREILVALAKVMPQDADLVARYRDVARRLSDSDRGAVERALDRGDT
ncbi:M56 family metallopeptidase [Dokdonella sp.]|uniref:M56 family metallopeptidase n=1 Tax=Dokdonella sp. TaxID=2291710 RepID=UPI001B0781FA|nr:M56 family metallopeptidase [Dokdonella sp.]MBO9664942.1 M56 family metallopeptidase [Dokdonella sp.]